MSIHDDIVNFVTGDITHLGLLTGPTVAEEISGGSPAYSRLVPTYSAASAGSADLTAPLEFNGPADAGPITHILYVRTAPLEDVIRPVETPTSLNEDGRINIVSARVPSTFLSVS